MTVQSHGLREFRVGRCGTGVANHRSGHGIGSNPLHAALSTISPLSPPKRTATYLAYTWATAAYRDTRSFQLRITLDSKYPAIADRCRQAVDILIPRQCARGGLARDMCTE